MIGNSDGHAKLRERDSSGFFTACRRMNRNGMMKTTPVNTMAAPLTASERSDLIAAPHDCSGTGTAG